MYTCSSDNHGLLCDVSGPAPLTQFGDYEQQYLNHYDNKQQVEAQNRCDRWRVIGSPELFI